MHTDVLSVTDAARHDDVWFVLDQQSLRVHRIGSSAESLGSFGGRGQGPGEFSFPQAIAMHGDTVVVAGENVMHLFTPDGRHIVDRKFSVTDCRSPVPTVRSAASASSGILLLIECIPLSGSMEVWLIASDGNSRTLVHDGTGSQGGLVADFNSIPILSSHPRGFLFGNVRDDCLGLYDPVGRPLETVCHGWLERLEIPDGLATELAETADDVRRQARRAGLQVHVVDLTRLWPFVRVFVTAREGLAYVAPVPIAGEWHHLVSRDVAYGKGNSPEPVAHVLFVAQGSVLASWNEIEGSRIAIYEVFEP